MSWITLAERLENRERRARITSALRGVRKSIAIGRSCNSAGFSNCTPVEIIPGNNPPELRGRPYLSTTFRRAGFSKKLYTPSTLHVIVGSDWLKR